MREKFMPLVMADQDYAEIWEYIENRVKDALDDYSEREHFTISPEDGIQLEEDIENLCDDIARNVVEFANNVPKAYRKRESIHPRKHMTRDEDLYRSNVDYYDDIEIPEGSQDEDIYYKPEPIEEKRSRCKENISYTPAVDKSIKKIAQDILDSEIYDYIMELAGPTFELYYEDTDIESDEGAEKMGKILDGIAESIAHKLVKRSVQSGHGVIKKIECSDLNLCYDPVDNGRVCADFYLEGTITATSKDGYTKDYTITTFYPTNTMDWEHNSFDFNPTNPTSDLVVKID